MSQLVYERMRDALEQLGMPRALENVDGLLDRVGDGGLSVVDVLDQLLGAELGARRERSIAMRLKLAGLPTIKTIEQFDFSFQPSLDEARIRDLHTLRFIANGHNVIFLGPPGCGKTHLSTSLGHAAITKGEMVHFTTARELFAKLRSSDGLHFKRLTANRAKLLIIDEVGYERLDPEAARNFFRLVCERYERGSIILTSNKRFSEWGELLGDDTLAGAILDRLLHHATTFTINGPSYRLKEKRRAGFLDADDRKGGEIA
ncbi:MAG: ATP-binding protein [Candidatus Eremiobacteraeota bacterium]|nr:ATP-binding protein [Candidatus Eremiobacteraeota bacterium]